MKTIVLKIAPFFFTLILLLGAFPFSSCEPEDEDNNPADSNPVVRKPNIYIYPETRMQLQITLSFPQGGEVLTSIPEYGNGWDIQVEPGGMIDGSYSYLFYESVQPDRWQYSKGWLMSREDLEDFFRSNLETYGFAGREIEDFAAYWIPRLKEYPLYLIYPQEEDLIRELVTIDFSTQPDNLLRLFYLIRGVYGIPDTKPIEPVINSPFSRDGFYVTEWGVILGN